VYNKSFKGGLDKEKLIEKIKFDQLSDEKLQELESISSDAMLKIAMDNSDAVIIGSETLNDELQKYVSSLNVPILDFQAPEHISEAYSGFYLNTLLK
jgi:starch synthase